MFFHVGRFNHKIYFSPPICMLSEMQKKFYREDRETHVFDEYVERAISKIQEAQRIDSKQEVVDILDHQE